MFSPSTPGSAVSIISRLRPRSVGELLDQAFRLYRKHFLTFLAMAAVVFVPVNLVVQTATTYLQGSLETLDNDLLSGRSGNEILITTLVGTGLVLAFTVLGYFVQYLSHGAITASVVDSYLDKPVSFGGGYRAILHRVGVLLGTAALQMLVGVVIFLPLVLLILLAAGSGSGDAVAGLVCLMFGLMIPLMILFAYVFVRWQVVVPVIMVEGLGPREALRRSWALVENYWWRTLGLYMLLYLITSVIAAGPAYLLLAVLLVFARSIDPILLSVLTGALSTAISLFIVPLELIALTLYYFDLRVRKEGFDLEAAINQRYWPQLGSPFGPRRSPALATAAAGMPANGTGTPVEPPVLGERTRVAPPSLEQMPPPEAAPPTLSAPALGRVPGEEPSTGGEPTEQQGESPVDPGQETAPTPDWLARPGSPEATNWDEPGAAGPPTGQGTQGE